MTTIERTTAVAIGSWKLVIGRLNETLAATRDEDLQKHVAAGRNRVCYLIGHLTAVHDRLFPMLGLGDRLYPQVDAIFLDNSDGPSADAISPADLRKAWNDVNSKLTAAFEKISPEQWLEKHASVSQEDFEKDPLRNRLAVLLNRTNHASFHAGQIRLTK